MKSFLKRALATIMVVLIVLTSAPLSGFVEMEWDWFGFSVKAGAVVASGQCGEKVFWEYDNVTETLYISGSGDMYDYSNINDSPFSFSDIKSVVLKNNVTSIGYGAFSFCYYLENIIIPNSVTNIGGRAFSNCYSLAYIEIPNGVTSIGEGAFSDSGIREVIIENGVKNIGDSAFSYCDCIVNITIPNSVTSIGDKAFYSCDMLTNIAISNGLISIGSEAFSFCDNLVNMTIPNSVTSIGEKAFYSCNMLANIIISDSVASIGSEAFSNCDKLTSVKIPNSMSIIGYRVFYGCEALRNIIIPDSVKTISEEAFSFCRDLTNVYYLGERELWECIVIGSENDCLIDSNIYFGDIENSLHSDLDGDLICDDCGDQAQLLDSGNCGINFNDTVKWNYYNTGTLIISGNGPMYRPSDIDYYEAGCFASNRFAGLKNVIIKEGVKSIGSEAFFNALEICNVQIANTVECIDYNAFTGCVNLSNITLPDSIKEIKTGAFSGCTNLKSIVMPKLLSYVPSQGFWGCRNLTNVVLHNEIKDIGSYAFMECVNLESITIPNSVTLIEQGAFYNCTSLRSFAIPKGVEIIYGTTFSGCINLESVHIPKSITGRDWSAFQGCDNLKDVYYGGSKEEWKNLNISSLWDVALYNATKHYNYDILRFTSTKEVYPSVETYYITPKALGGGLEKNDKVSKGVVVTNNKEEEFNGKIKLERSDIIDTSGSAKGNIIIKVDGYRNCIIPNAVIENIRSSEEIPNYYSTTAYMQLYRNDEPYISSVYARNNGDMEYYDIRANKIHCDKNNFQDIIVSVGGLTEDETVSKVVILQSSEESFESSDGVFNDVKLAERLEQEKKVYVYAVINNIVTNEVITTDTEELKIEIGGNYQFGDGINNTLSMDLLGNDGQSFAIDTDIPYLKDSKISFDGLKTPIGVSRVGDVWRISIGVDIFSNEGGDDNSEFEKGDWIPFKKQVDEVYGWLAKKDDNLVDSYSSAINKFNEIKNKFGDEKKIEEYLSANKKTDFDFNFGVLGYIEGTYVDEQWVTTSCGGGIIVNVLAEKTIPISVCGFPCYWGFGGGVESKTEFKGTRAVASKEVPIATTFVLNIDPFFSAKFGAGVDKLLYAELNGKGSFPTKFETADKYLKIEFNAEIGWEAGIWVLSANGTIWEFKEPVTLYEKYFDNKATLALRNFADDYPLKLTNKNKTKVNVLSRDYAETTSEWLYGKPERSTFALKNYIQQGVEFSNLQQSVFADSKLQMVQVGNNTFATWIEDDSSRDTYNRMRLVYSVRNCDTGFWSKPKAVWDTGVNDGYPSVVTDGEKVYIAWQKINKVITEADCSDATVFYNNGEICLAEYHIDVDEIVSSKIITDNRYYDYSPVVIVNNSNPVVFWISSIDNNMTSMDGCELNRYSDGITTTLLESISSPVTVSVEAIDGKEYISYCTDTDGDFSTTEDITVNTYLEGTITTFDKDDNSLAIKDAKYGKLDGESVLFMQDGTNIFYEENGETVTVFDVERNIDGDFVIVEAINGTQLLWTEKEENGSSDIYSCVYTEDEWSDPVKVSENDKYITNLVAVCANGKIIGGCNRTEVIYDEETQKLTKGLTDLNCWSMQDFNDISIELFSYKEKSFIDRGSNSFDLHITNNGTINVDEIEFVIEDALGNSTTVIKEVNIISGCAKTVEIPYAPAENYTSTILTVTANIPNDVDEENNVTFFDVGSCDLMFESCTAIETEDYFDISALASNISTIDAENVVLSIYVNSNENEAIEVFDVGNVNAVSLSDINISLKKELISFENTGTAIVYLKLVADVENNISNNLVCVPLVLGKTKECAHPLLNVIESKEATCTEIGYNEYTFCSACKEKLTEYTEHPVLDHKDTDMDNKCDSCGKSMSDILVGETKTIEIKSNEITYLKFIPYETAEYTFESNSDEDTYGYLYDADKNQLTYNDDGGSGSNFSISYTLTAGETYYWGARFYYEDEGGTFDVMLTTQDQCRHKNAVLDEGTLESCISIGYTAGTYCNDCETWIEGHEVIPATNHLNQRISILWDATCEESGYMEGVYCLDCNEWIEGAGTIEPKGHNYENDICKNCSMSRVDNCRCMCHKNGVMGVVWKIFKVILKIFNANPNCSCNAAHY